MLGGVSQEQRPGRPRQRGQWDWRARSATGLLGLAGGMAVNVVSSDVGYRGVAAVAAVGAALAASNWLRKLPPRADPLVRWCSRLLLGAALFAALIAGLPSTPRPWSGYTTTAAVILVATALLLAA